jgi:hypothetical protein
MMSFEIDRDELVTAVSQTLEETAFLFVEESDGTQSPWEDETVMDAKIRFHGSSTGFIDLAVDEQFAVELAANLLGTDPTSDQAARSARDAFGEMVNILCGVLLEKWFPGDSSLGMDVPNVRSLPVAEYEEETSRARIKLIFVTDEGKRIDTVVFS